MGDAMGLFEAIHTQRAIRRYKLDPVPDDVLQQVLEAATRAPSGGNRQPWRFVVVRKPEVKEKIARYYRMSVEGTYGPRLGPPEAEPDTPAAKRRFESRQWFIQNFGRIPVLIFVCADMSGLAPGMTPDQMGSSIFPAVQNLMLAARALGLGTVLTTLWKRHEQEMKGVLGIPDNVAPLALIPLGYAEDRFGGSKRKPLSEVVHYDGWA
ncbi:MAG: nitroreductase family protein [Chloroflexi bacterium]|nr:nitroreductase family protein [Chloroflexota bacterium]